ncbi:helix-turn-helix domain-containing protein [Cupriavidus taiwanensis]|uniref:helix-turn-helix domain-containing protein n=1 Tax=Cupriavidus taiwanensis TaxID=164546 RepID=UPI000E2F9DFE|nr:helix-turn-helix transcriptional regulator [Cupriavidus taiwanensis]
MSTTEFGRLVRKARIDADVTLLEMARQLDVSAPFLSGMETGRKKISQEWVGKIEEFFRSKYGIEVPGLDVAADIANREVSLEGLSPQHQMLVAGFARMKSIDPEVEEQFRQLLTAAGNYGKE